MLFSERCKWEEFRFITQEKVADTFFFQADGYRNKEHLDLVRFLILNNNNKKMGASGPHSSRTKTSVCGAVFPAVVV